MELTVYKLHFNSPLHLGNEKLEYSHSEDHLYSDTLNAAFIEIMAQIGVESYDSNLPFTISSLFPFYQKDKKSNAIYFLPVPELLKSKKLSDEKLHYRKLFKKIRWAELNWFNELINGRDITELDIVLFKDQFLTDKEVKPFIKRQVFPRVTVPRLAGESDVFFIEKLFFSDFSGFFFIALGETELLDKLLDLLQYNGIGTDKNLGLGRFVWNKDIIEISFSPSDYIMNLSLFIPEDRQFIFNSVSYKLVRRGGWITTFPFQSLRKNEIFMIEEGSIFKYSADTVLTLGNNVDLTPEILKDKEIKIFRSGKSLFIPIKF